MSLELLKQKLHAIFEQCENGCEIKEEAQPQKEFTDSDGVVYLISFDPATKQYIVKEQSGQQKDAFTFEQKDIDGNLKKDSRNNIVNALTPSTNEPVPTKSSSEPTTPTEPTTLTEPVKAQEPTEAVVEEVAINEVNNEMAKNFKTQYGDRWKEVYYAYCNKNNINPETGKPK